MIIEKCEKWGDLRKCKCDYGWKGYDCKNRYCMKEESKRCGTNGKYYDSLKEIV